MLYLQQQLDPLNGCYRRLGDGCSHSTCQEVLGEGHSGICHVEKEEKAGDCRTRLGTGWNSEALGRSRANGRFIYGEPAPGWPASGAGSAVRRAAGPLSGSALAGGGDGGRSRGVEARAALRATRLLRST